MKIGVSEWKALKKETKLKLLRYAMLESKYKYAKIKALHLQKQTKSKVMSDRLGKKLAHFFPLYFII